VKEGFFIEFDYPDEVGETFTVKLDIVNNTDGIIYDINFINMITGELKLLHPPENVKFLEKGDKTSMEVKLKAMIAGSVG